MHNCAAGSYVALRFVVWRLLHYHIMPRGEMFTAVLIDTCAVCGAGWQQWLLLLFCEHVVVVLPLELR